MIYGRLSFKATLCHFYQDLRWCWADTCDRNRLCSLIRCMCNWVVLQLLPLLALWMFRIKLVEEKKRYYISVLCYKIVFILFNICILFKYILLSYFINSFYLFVILFYCLAYFICIIVFILFYFKVVLFKLIYLILFSYFI